MAVLGNDDPGAGDSSPFRDSTALPPVSRTAAQPAP